MSFIKSLKCYFCSEIRSLGEENFPEDLFDLLLDYKSDQLLWVCKVCKNDLDGKTARSACCLFRKRSEIRDMKDTEYVEGHKFTVTPNDQNNCIVYNIPVDSVADIVDSESDNQSELSFKSFSGSPKENKSALKYVHEVLNKIKITRNEKLVNKSIINSVLDILITNLKKSEEFSSMYNRLYYTGSAYNDLRITSATEYDINVVLQVPNNIDLMPDFFDKSFAFGKLKWEASSKSNNIPLPVTRFLEKCSVENFLQPQMVLSWFQCQIDLILKERLTYPSEVHSVKTSSSGPARTIIINTTLGYSINIDLVPVFEFPYSVLYSTTIFSEVKKTSEDTNKDNLFTVPKMCEGEIPDISLSDSKFAWRLDFPNAEKHILYNKGCARNVIKILKILRDKRNWKRLASHYLKMVVMLEIIKNPSAEHWNNGFAFERILDVLNQLKTYLKDQHLPHFITQQNLLYKMNKDEGINYSNYLNGIISTIESAPEKIVELF